MNKGIGIAGIGGRMGRLLAEEVAAARETLAGGIERPGIATPPGATLWSYGNVFICVTRKSPNSSTSFSKKRPRYGFIRCASWRPTRANRRP